VPFWPGLRCSRTREVEDLGERRGGVALGSWTADADSHRRPPDNTTYESGSSLRTLVMRQFALCQPTR
jgi:hypothetical protein